MTKFFTIIFVVMPALTFVGCSEERGNPAGKNKLEVQIIGRDELSQKAEAGDPDAQCAMGMMCYHCKADEEGFREAAEWYLKAAQQGHARGQVLLGRMYIRAEGLEKDGKQALAWMKTAAAQGDAEAQRELGQMYYAGDVITKDNAKALDYLVKSAEQGDICALFTLIGGIFCNESDVQKDPQEVIKWCGEAIDLAKTSNLNPGVKYVTRELLEKLREQHRIDVAALGTGANGSMVRSQYQLGQMYMAGREVDKDLTKAYKWFTLAGLGGQDVTEEKQQLKKLLNSRQISMAEKQAIAFLAERKKSSRDDFEYSQKVKGKHIIDYELPSEVWRDVEIVDVPPPPGDTPKDRWQFQAVTDQQCLYLRFTYHEKLPDIGRNLAGELELTDKYLGHLPLIDVIIPPESYDDYKYVEGFMAGIPAGRLRHADFRITTQFNLNWRKQEDTLCIRFISANSFDKDDIDENCELLRFSLSACICRLASEPAGKTKDELGFWYQKGVKTGRRCVVSLKCYDFESCEANSTVFGNSSNLITYQDRSFVLRVPFTQSIVYCEELTTPFLQEPIPQMSLRIRPYNTNRFRLYLPKTIDFSN